MPDPLVFDDGAPVRSPDEWERRRSEMRDSLLKLQYGRMPPAPGPGSLRAELVSEAPALGGAAVDRRLRLTIGGGGSEITVRVGILTPARTGKFGAVVKNDVAIGHVPVADELVRRGYAVVEYLRTDLDPDESGVAGAAQRAYPEFDWGTLAVWAWGGMRVIDYLVSLPEIDAGRLVVFGHSRGGKTALLTGALDERVDLTVANGSGTGGAALYRDAGDGAESLEAITRPDRFAYWFSPRMRDFAGREDELPFDQHWLRALIAPRAVLSTDANGDRWANPQGTRQARDGAAPVFEFLGAPPWFNSCNFRDGGHDETVEDWRAVIEFLDKRWG